MPRRIVDAVQMLGDDIFNEDLAPGGGYGGHIGARLDLVWNNGVGSAPQPGDPPNFDDVGARPPDIGPHGVEEVGQIGRASCRERV